MRKWHRETMILPATRMLIHVDASTSRVPKTWTNRIFTFIAFLRPVSVKERVTAKPILHFLYSIIVLSSVSKGRWKLYSAAMLACIMSKTLLAAAQEGALKQYRPVKTLNFKGPTYSLAWSREGDRLAVLTSPNLSIFDQNSWIETANISVLRRLYLGRSISFFDSNSIIIGGAISAENDRGNNKGSLTVIDINDPNRTVYLPDNSVTQSPENLKPQDNFALNSLMDKLIAWNVDAHELYLYDMRTFTIKKTMGLPSVINPTPAANRTPDAPPTINDSFSAVSFSPDSKTIAACSAMGNLYFIDGNTLEISKSINIFPPGVRCTSLAYSSDGQFLALGRQQLLIRRSSAMFVAGTPLQFEGNSGGIKVISLAGDKVVSTISEFEGSVGDLAWIPDRRSLVIADGKNLRVLDFVDILQGKYETQYVGPSAVKISISRHGDIAAIHGSDVSIYQGK